MKNPKASRSEAEIPPSGRSEVEIYPPLEDSSEPKEERGNGIPSSNPNPQPDDVVISVKNVSKKFCRNLRRSMVYGIVDLSKNLFGVKSD